jgi:uncharacterized repeat protein (TIGR01451 family)
MNNILSGISGYFGKALILGTFFPVVMFAIFTWLLIVPMFPVSFIFLSPLSAFDAEWKLLAFSFLAIVLTGLLFNINTPLIRLYEGYPWADLWIGRRRKKHYQRQLRLLQAQWLGIPFLEYELNRVNPNDTRLTSAINKKSIVGRNLKTDFPEDENLVLPTRLGNAIRSFENYSNTQYRIEAVVLWPRLIAQLDEDYAAEIEGSKTSFDFMLNCTTLSLVLALELFIIGLLYPMPLTSWQSFIFWLSKLSLSCLVAQLFYRLSVNRAKAWGNLVKGAFDLYRWDLLKRLGYSHMPGTVEDERALWHNISQRMTYGDTYTVPPVEYAPRTTLIKSTPSFASLQVGRGIEVPHETGELIVKLRVVNVGDYNARQVVITDTLPDGFQYLWDTASISNTSDPTYKVSVIGINPYHFTVGKIDILKEVVLTYRGLAVNKEVKEHKAAPQAPSDNRLMIDFRWLDNEQAVVTSSGEKGESHE